MNLSIYINIFKKEYFFFFVTLFLILSSSCNNNQEEEQTTTEDSVVIAGDIAQEDSILFFENKADEWLDLSFHNNNNTDTWKKFKLKEFWYEDSLPAQTFKPEQGFYKDYAPLLKWSPDSSYVLDIGTYGKVLVKDKNGSISIRDGEVDSKASLIFTKAGTISELVFLGAGGSIIDGHWIDTTQFSLLGSFDEKGDQHPDTLLWVIDVKDRFFRKYKLE